MSSKPPSGLADGSGSHGAESDSLEDTLNQILAEADAPVGVPPEKPAAAEADEAPTPLGGLSDEPDAANSFAAAAAAAASAVVVRTAEELASMSGPALVDDLKEEATDVESAEALAAAAARTEAAPPEPVGTPVGDVESEQRDNVPVPQEEIVTATGGAPPHDVITAQNVDSYTPPKEAHRPLEANAVPLADQARDQRARALRSHDRLLTPPVSGFPGAGAEPSAEAFDDESELEMSDLSYDQAEASEPSSSYSDGDDTASLVPRRPGGAESRSISTRGNESGPLRMTPAQFPTSGPGSGRHALPPPLTPSPGSPARARLPTPKPGSGPAIGTSSQRISGSSIPVVIPVGASGPTSGVRPTSAVFSKVQLPLGGLVTVVGAAFGVGLIIGALLWRGTAEPSPEATPHAGDEASKATGAVPESPAPSGTAVAAPVAPAPSPPPQQPPAAVAVAPAVAPAAQPPSPPTGAAPARSPSPAVAQTAPAATEAAATGKKPSAATTKSTRLKHAAAGSPAASAAKTDATAGKAKAAAWVDPFAE